MEIRSETTDFHIINLDILSLAEMQAASVLLFRFCQNAVIQFSRLETVLQHEKTELIINSPCCGKGKLSVEQSTRPEKSYNNKYQTPPIFKGLEAKSNAVCIAMWALQQGEPSKHVFTAKNYTTAKPTCFASFKCTSTNLCFQYNSVIFQPKINSCLKNIRLNW